MAIPPPGPDRLGETYPVKEKIATAFAKADFEGQLGSLNTFGNVGLQFVNTRQSSTGYTALTGENLFVQATPVVDVPHTWEHEGTRIRWDPVRSEMPLSMRQATLVHALVRRRVVAYVTG